MTRQRERPPARAAALVVWQVWPERDPQLDLFVPGASPHPPPLSRAPGEGSVGTPGGAAGGDRTVESSGATTSASSPLPVRGRGEGG